MKLRRIQYAPSHPRNIRVNCDPAAMYPTPAPISMAFISLGKTENPKEDWKLCEGRGFQDGVQCLFFESNGGSALVWLECPEGSLTVAEQIGPTEVCVVCIPRGAG